MSELSQEQIDKLGFTPTQAELEHVDRMAETVIKDMHTKTSFEGSRNRDASKRMNRPEKLAKQDEGNKFIIGLLSKLEDEEVAEKGYN
tara:strand:- start:1258 stop:1521 length:264 start_codon:yes stop_codon:yes gene_type:complete